MQDKKIKVAKAIFTSDSTEKISQYWTNKN